MPAPTELGQRCRQLGIKGVTLHSYRYAWAERAKACGYPERFAQEALGHNSKAVYGAYAKRALMRLPSLQQWEEEASDEEASTVNVNEKAQAQPRRATPTAKKP